MAPKVFIGSSTRGLRTAETIQRALSHESEAIVWTQGIFRHINVPIEDLMKAVNEFDFAVFVFLPEDVVSIREKDTLSVRDNVIFELGLFLGRLGRQRNFFITPKTEPKMELHLPSDLSGITPATYDPDSGNFLAAIGNALYELKESIHALGALTKHEAVLYDSTKEFKQYYFEHRNSYIYKDNKKDSPKSDAVLHFLSEGVLKVERKNLDGRFEIELRRDGPGKPSIAKEREPEHRIFRVNCECKVDGGQQKLRFVLKDIKADKWADHQSREINNTQWDTLEIYMRALSTVDLLFRIDFLEPTVASSVYVRKIVIVEEK